MAAIFADIQPSRDKERAQAVPDSDNDEVRPDSAPGMIPGFGHNGRLRSAEISQPLARDGALGSAVFSAGPEHAADDPELIRAVAAQIQAQGRALYEAAAEMSTVILHKSFLLL